MTSAPSTTTRRPPRASFGAGRLVLWNGGGAWVGRGTGRAEPHAHHAIQLTLALGDPFLIRGGDQTDWTPHPGAIVMPEARHQFDGAGQTVAIVFIEPETTHGRALLARHQDTGLVALDPATAEALAAPLHAAFDARVDDATFSSAARDAVDRLTGTLPSTSEIDPRISRAIDWIRARLSTPIALKDAAAAAHLSPDRFRHLFVAQTGTTFRAYLLWARVEAAVQGAMAGRSWTDAAQYAGFADSAHLSRTCRRMIGLAPGMLARE